MAAVMLSGGGYLATLLSLKELVLRWNQKPEDWAVKERESLVILLGFQCLEYWEIDFCIFISVTEDIF